MKAESGTTKSPMLPFAAVPRYFGTRYAAAILIPRCTVHESLPVHRSFVLCHTAGTTHVDHEVLISVRQFAILRYALRQWPKLVLLLVLTACMAAVSALQPWPMKLLVDHAVGQRTASSLPLWAEAYLAGLTRPELVITAALATVALFAVSTLLSSASSWTWAVAGQRMSYDVAEDLFGRLQRTPLLVHGKRTVGNSLSLLTTDIWSVYTLSGALVVGPVGSVLTMLAVGFVAWRLDSTLTLLALTSVPLLGASARYYGPRLLRRARGSRAAQVRLFTFLQRTLSSLPLVQAFSAEERNNQFFKQLSEDEIYRVRRNNLTQSAYSTIVGLIPTIGFAVVLYVGGRRVLSGGLSVGSLLVFLAYLRTMQGALSGLLDNYGSLKTVEANVERIFEVLDVEDVVPERADARVLPVRAARHGATVRLEGVVFGYEPERPVLKGVTLEARAGETVALVGATGAGKTTLVGLVPRFYDPWAGRVTIEGHDVKDLTLRSLRAQVSLVLQEAFILPLSVADNIAYGKPAATRSEIEAVAQAANAHEFITRLPEGYDTVVGERGATLSGGERQRLAIARALLKDAPILILDEPTSALDAGTERLVLDALDRLMQGRTVLVIAHRLSTVRRANRIVVLEHGKVVEQGTHDELLAAGGAYARVHAVQFAGITVGPGAAA